MYALFYMKPSHIVSTFSFCPQACRAIAPQFPSIKYEEMIVDNTCMQLVTRPDQFDVMVRFICCVHLTDWDVLFMTDCGFNL